MTVERVRAYRDPRDLAGLAQVFAPADGATATRAIGMRVVDIAPDAFDRLTNIVDANRNQGPIALLVDAEPIRRAGSELKQVAARDLGSLAPVIVVRLGEVGHELHAEAAAIDEATARARGAGAVVAVGSGTICDIGKEVSRQLGVPYTVVQTANSVNAFSDDMAVLLIRGVKRTVPSRWPDALVVDLQVLADAPAELNRAGVGELTAMWTAPADWRLAAAVGADDSYDERIVGLFRDGADALVAAAPGAAGDLASIEVMAELMTLSGIALGVAGRTAPISGTEHGISHLLDISAASDGRSTGLHGAQVGVAALVAAVIWQRVLDTADGDVLLTHQLRDDREARDAIDSAFLALDGTGDAAAECWEHYSTKMAAWRANVERRAASAAAWPAISAELSHLVAPPDKVARVLRSTGAPATFGELDANISADRQLWAVLNSPLQRERFSVADLAQAAGLWTRDFVLDVIAEADRIAASVTAADVASEALAAS